MKNVLAHLMGGKEIFTGFITRPAKYNMAYDVTIITSTEITSQECTIAVSTPEYLNHFRSRLL